MTDAPDGAPPGPQLLTVGRVSVDLYAQQRGAGFDEPQTFLKSVGGSPTNVAVAAARLGVRAAAVTAVGGDGFGAFVRARLAVHGVDTRWVATAPGSQTPLAIVALDDPQAPTVAFYRTAAPPDLGLTAAHLPEALVREVPALWVSHAALAAGPVATAVRTWLTLRARTRWTLLDLDHRPALWPDAAAASRSAAEAIARCDVVVGNREECRVAVGTADPDAAADALLAAGVTLAVVKLGADGVLLATARNRVRVPASPVDVVCGLGAGDAFGGALVRGLLSGPPLHALDPAAEARRLETIGRTGSAAGAFVAARLTCSDDMPTAADLAAVLSGAAAGGA